MKSYVYQVITQRYEKNAANKEQQGNPPADRDAPMSKPKKPKQEENSGGGVKKVWYRRLYESDNAREWLTTIAAIGAMLFTGILVNQGDEQLRGLQVSSHQQLRAYLTVDTLIKIVVWPGIPLTHTIVLKNTGQTPAHITRMRYGPKIAGTGVYPHEFNALAKDYRRGPYSVGPSQLLRTEFQHSNLFPDSVMYQIILGQRPLFILGELEYIDVFSDTHRTRYCFQYFPTADSTGTFFACDVFNTAE